ncbi:hypothetical protein AAFF_G00335340 [Aldrovandia affinis]|uniref:Uncharacterized protein n=1 Tax=Aldrovandia affinis TaxID=143900 RepID=A0AAD7SL95_9TELE|nr:hypothetical protein AAFF_G00335340 [Aldrovandia affinis]
MEGSDTGMTPDAMLHHLLCMHGEQQRASLAVMESLERNTADQDRQVYQEANAAYPDGSVYPTLDDGWRSRMLPTREPPTRGKREHRNHVGARDEGVSAMWSGIVPSWMNRCRLTKEPATRAINGPATYWSPT